MLEPERKEGQISEEEYLYDDSVDPVYDEIPDNFESSYQNNEENNYSLDQNFEDNDDNQDYQENTYEEENYEDNYEENYDSNNDYQEDSLESFDNQEYQEELSHDENQEHEQYSEEENYEDLQSLDGTEEQSEYDFDEIPEESYEIADEENSDLENHQEDNYEDSNNDYHEDNLESFDNQEYQEEFSHDENQEHEQYSEENYEDLPEDSFESEHLEQELEETLDELEIQEEVVEDTPPPEPEKPKLNVDDVKKEIHNPVQLEHTANYLMSLPILGVVVKEKYLENIKKETDDVKLRAIRVATQKEIIAQYKEEKQPYIITHFTNQENLCTVDKNCLYKEFKSVYYEVSNPVTNKNVMLTSHMYHNMTRHHMVYFNEPLLNLGNSPQGFFDAYLPCADLLTALKGSNVPQEVVEELEAVKEKIEYLEYERFAAVRGNVQYDMSVFEQTEYEKENNIIPFYSLLRTLVEWGAEDIHIKAGFRPMGVLGGDVKPCPSFPEFLTAERTKYYSSYLLTEPQIQQFEETLEMDNSFYVPGVARFRCNMYHSQGCVGMVFRVIPTKIRPVEVLGVPLILKKLVFERLGLVLVTGQTGSGKTTTLAAIVEFCNVNRAIHILTLENPVEYVYESKKSIFTQRAIEIDSLSFPMAMRGALRQKPDIILIGEMRDPDTIMAGLKAAETGHLVMSTLHTNDAVQTINRIVNTFPPHEQETIRVQVGSTIKACVAQRLIPRFDKPGRVCSIEVMLVTPNARGQNTRGYIIRNEVPELYKVVATSGYDGMQSMNMALFEHYRNGVITPDDALSYSDNPDEVTRWMREDMGLGASV
ncbi:MAG: PilT/PilU family type 4a pilus ATPase [Candidatus Sericytochromatia bacterium]